jgi:putative phosphoesterase
MVLNFPTLADYCYLLLDGISVFATHGHLYNLENLPPLRKGEILLHGHTHVPACNEHETYTYINPGSVSIPKENSHHGYMILENGTFTWKNLEGDVVKVYSVR